MFYLKQQKHLTSEVEQAVVSDCGKYSSFFQQFSQIINIDIYPNNQFPVRTNNDNICEP